MSLRLILLYGWSRNNLTGAVLCYVRFVDTFKNILTLEGKFEMQYGRYFLEARNSNIAEDLQAPNFLQGARTTYCPRTIGIATLLLQCPKALCYLEEEEADVLGFTHIREGLFLTDSYKDAVLFSWQRKNM